MVGEILWGGKSGVGVLLVRDGFSANLFHFLLLKEDEEKEKGGGEEKSEAL